jgi:hypothetical protein
MPRILSSRAIFLTVMAACHATAHDTPDAAQDAAPAAGATQEMVFMANADSSLGAQGSEIVMMNLDGTSRVQLTDNDVQEFLPHFSPDATKVVYTKFTTGGYGQADSTSVVAVVDTSTLVETELTATGKDAYPVWSPDGSRLAFLSTRDHDVGHGGPELWMMNADGSNPHRIAGPVGIESVDDQLWGDIAWSSDDWILFVVAQGMGGSCFKARLDKIRPDGTARTQVTDGGPNCTPDGMEQSGDADPGFSSDGHTIYSSRGLPRAPGGTPPAGTTERRLYAFSADAWTADKVEHDLTLASEPDCIEGVPKGSPDGTRVLEFRACWYTATEPSGVMLTDTAGSYRAYIADGFGPDWNPAR